MTKPNSLYIHIPFCNSLCDYCDFPKLLYIEKFAEKYINALKIELDGYDPKGVETIFIGGGTPTSLSDFLFEKLLKIVEPFSKNVIEYSVECNPESLTYNKILLMKKYGVNRVSIGVESTNDKILKSINRKHTFNDVKNAINLLVENGIDNINVDLIIGLPNVTGTMFKKDLTNIVGLKIKHISCYSLTVHEHTVFFNKNINEPDEKLSRNLYDFAHSFLKEKGFVHYEISNWSKEGFQSKHNLTYWKNEEYYGCGLGASGYIGKIRYKNTQNLDKYFTLNFIDEKENVTQSDLKTYELMTNLRTIYGLNTKSYKFKTGEDILINKEKEIKDLIERKLIVLEEDTIRPTYEGMMILDSILLKLI